MKCKGCGSKKDVVKYGKGLNYKGVGLPSGPRCHDCMRAIKKQINAAIAPGKEDDDGSKV